MGSARAHGGAGPSLARACRPLGFSVSYQRLVRVIVIRYGRVLFRGLYSVLRDTALDSSLAIHGAYGASLVAHRWGGLCDTGSQTGQRHADGRSRLESDETPPSGPTRGDQSITSSRAEERRGGRESR